jgi:hypothetical protein
VLGLYPLHVRKVGLGLGPELPSCLTEYTDTIDSYTIELLSYQVLADINIDSIGITGANTVQTSCQIWHLCRWFVTCALILRGDLEVGLRTVWSRKHGLCIVSG